MFPQPNYVCKCTKCGSRKSAHIDESDPDVRFPQKCPDPDCDGEMECRPTVMGGPLHDNPNIRY